MEVSGGARRRQFRIFGKRGGGGCGERRGDPDDHVRGAWCRWDQDAHFALPRVRAAWAEQCVFSGNPHDETGDFSSRTTAGDGAAGGPDAREGLGRMRAGAASSARAEQSASKVSGKVPESFRKR